MSFATVGMAGGNHVNNIPKGSFTDIDKKLQYNYEKNTNNVSSTFQQNRSNNLDRQWIEFEFESENKNKGKSTNKDKALQSYKKPIEGQSKLNPSKFDYESNNSKYKNSGFSVRDAQSNSSELSVEEIASQFASRLKSIESRASYINSDLVDIKTSDGKHIQKKNSLNESENKLQGEIKMLDEGLEMHDKSLEKMESELDVMKNKNSILESKLNIQVNKNNELESNLNQLKIQVENIKKIKNDSVENAANLSKKENLLPEKKTVSKSKASKDLKASQVINPGKNTETNPASKIAQQLRDRMDRIE